MGAFLHRFYFNRLFEGILILVTANAFSQNGLSSTYDKHPSFANNLPSLSQISFIPCNFGKY